MTNIHQPIEKNSQLEREISAIHNILTQDIFFSRIYTDEHDHKRVAMYRFFDFADMALFPLFQSKNDCANLTEYMARGEAILEFDEFSNLTEHRIINYLEVVENLLNVFSQNSVLFKRHGFDVYPAPYNKVLTLIKKLERHMKIRKRATNSKVILKKRGRA